MSFKFTLRRSNTLPPLMFMAILSEAHATAPWKAATSPTQVCGALSKQDPAGGHQQTSELSHYRMCSLLSRQKNGTATGHSARRRVESGRSITAARLPRAIHSKLRLTTRQAAILYLLKKHFEDGNQTQSFV